MNCSICKRDKASEHFYGSDRRCKSCQSLVKKEKYSEAKMNSHHIDSDTITKKCIGCKTIKGVKDFPKHILSKDGFANTCWKCKNDKYDLNLNPNKFWWRRACITNRKKGLKIKALDLRDVFVKQNKSCIYCGIHLTDINISVDHILPTSRGGLNIIKNIQILCSDCNFLKLDKTHIEFKDFLDIYVPRLFKTLTRTEELQNATQGQSIDIEKI